MSKSLDIFSAFKTLFGRGTHEDILVEVAKQQNTPFNDLPQLQKDVDVALEQSELMGFVECMEGVYKLTPSVTGGARIPDLQKGQEDRLKVKMTYSSMERREFYKESDSENE